LLPSEQLLPPRRRYCQRLLNPDDPIVGLCLVGPTSFGSRGTIMTNQTKSKPLEKTAATEVHVPGAAIQPETKVATLIALLIRPEGATLDQMVVATGWQPHTTRAALTRLKSRGYVVASGKVEGIRTYRASGPAAS
jgi:hypothetical protein